MHEAHVQNSAHGTVVVTLREVTAPAATQACCLSFTLPWKELRHSARPYQFCSTSCLPPFCSPALSSLPHLLCLSLSVSPSLSLTLSLIHSLTHSLTHSLLLTPLACQPHLGRPMRAKPAAILHPHQAAETLSAQVQRCQHNCRPQRQFLALSNQHE
jgi:hypothetical protein